MLMSSFFRVEELRDSTAHAEMICIREASKQLKTWRLAVIFCYYFYHLLIHMVFLIELHAFYYYERNDRYEEEDMLCTLFKLVLLTVVHSLRALV